MKIEGDQNEKRRKKIEKMRNQNTKKSEKRDKNGMNLTESAYFKNVKPKRKDVTIQTNIFRHQEENPET